MSDESTQPREPTVQERRLLQALATRWSSSPRDWVRQVTVRPMADGGMGSLELLPPDLPQGSRRFGSRVAELQFKDDDGVVVIASLNVDQNKVPFELDVWKTDFSPLHRIPDRL